MVYGLRRYDLKRQRLKQELEIELVEAEKLKELDSMKSRFFANISHEFRTPLTLVLGPLEKVLDSVSGEAKSNLVIMQRNARRLQHLINELLSLSKLESGQMKLHARKLNLVKVVNGYVQSFESLAKQREIALVFKSHSDDIQAYVDKEKLEKILFNLLSNAFKFTASDGRIDVEVGRSAGTRGPEDPLTRRPADPSDFIEIQISDTGAGISQENLPHIFDRFYQATDSYTKVQEGTGIGLALTKELIELHNGWIEVDSKVGAGTMFRIYFLSGKGHLKPGEIVTGDEPEDIREHSLLLSDFDENPIITPEDKEPGKEKPLLLVVEDNDDLRSHIRSYLADTYRIAESVDGKMGLDRAIEEVPDLVISDVMMPIMDGIELCTRLKTDERTSHIPVVLLTARADIEDKLEGLETGADDYITKPFDARELLVRIKNLLEVRQKLRERFFREAKKIGLSALSDLSITGVSSMEQKFLVKAIGVVKTNLSDPEFTVKRFCLEMAMSNMQLHRKLVAVTGQTANRFIRSYRLSRAASLLEKRAGNVTEIAYEVGFNNLSWFAKCFQEQFGMPPSEYASKSNSL
jgi:DNA-binding response OmpR family regulator/nitrogen-specific signal transduction histidine kinase